MKNLRSYIRRVVVEISQKTTPTGNPLPNPPSLRDRIKELEKIRERRIRPVTPPEYSKILDTGMVDIFNRAVVSAGYPDHHEKIRALKNQILPEIIFYKNYFNEMRPRELAEEMGELFDYDNLESAQTPSYPSGHTAQAFYVAWVLSKDFPDLTSTLFLIANMIGESRIDRGVHFPSDNEAGKILAKHLFEKSQS